MSENKRFYEFGDFRLDVENKVLRRDQTIIALTPKVFDTLFLLVENAGKLVEKDVLMEKIWHDRFVEESNITFNIKMLRKALGDDAASPTYIETVPRRGYRFIAELRETVEKETVENTPEAVENVEKEEVKPPPLIATKKTSRKYIGALFAGIVLLAVLGFTFYYKRTRHNPAQSFQQINANRLTSSGKSFFAIISPDGKYIIHAQTDGEKQSLWIRQTGETRDIEIVPASNGQFIGLAVSPDSKSVFYTLAPEDNQPNGVLYQVPILGGTSRQIISDIDSGVSFSADGNEFVFYRTSLSRAVSQLLIANADGTHQHVVAERAAPETFETEFGNPVWKSGERKLIAIGASNAPNAKSDLLEIDLETGLVKPFLEVRWKEISQIAWLKNSQSVLLTAFDEDTNTSQLWHIDPAKGSARKVTNDVSNYRGISLTDDENTLITTQTGQVTRLWKTADKTAATAEEVFSETGNVGENEGLVWTAENQLIFSLGEQKYDNIMLLDRNNMRPLTVDSNGNRQPAVCGNSIVYAANFVAPEPNKIRLWKMDKNGKNPQRLTADEGESETYPHCSAKSDWVVYQRGWESTTVWKIPIAGGAAVQLTKTLSFQPVISPDGKTFAYYYLENNKWGIAVAALEDGKLLKEFPISSAGKLRHLRWTSDGKNLAYSETRKGISNIWLQPLDANARTRLTNFDSGVIFYFDWSPDGKNLAYTQGIISSDVVSISDVK